MPYSNARKRWDKENTVVFSVKFFKTSEQDLIDFMDSKVNKKEGIGRGTVLKQALKFYMDSEQNSKASATAPDEEEDIDAWLNSD